MRKKSLIHTRNTRTWTGEQLHLEYYLLSEPILGGCADSYGVEVLARNGNEVEYAGVPGITLTGTRILQLIDRLAAGTVPPTGPYDVVQDWI